MNFEALNWLINSVISNFKCSDCKSWATIKDINIKNIEWQSVTLDIVCPSCNKNTFIKSEVMSVDLSKMNLTGKQIELLKSTISKNNSNKLSSFNNKINDNFIVELNKNLKKDNISVSDLLAD